jgi:hypothetical protein
LTLQDVAVHADSATILWLRAEGCPDSW